ncbi:MAG: TrkA family potassium uptake protein [Chloroflexi bacterium]|nr:TrkA family potassium uptake protein [Chloroflexota bacterium]
MNIIVVGCGRVGAQLANRLFQQGHHVTVVDQAATAFDNLDQAFRGRTLEGDVLAQDLLRRAGIEKAHALAVVTSSDTVNCVVGHVARTVYGVPNVVARNYEPRYRSLYEAFNLHAVGPSIWGAQRIEEMLTDDPLRTVFSAGNGEVEIYEVLVSNRWRGRKLREMLTSTDCLPVALTRAGRAVLPTPDTMLEECDVLHVSATRESIETLRQRLAKEA